MNRLARSTRATVVRPSSARAGAPSGSLAAARTAVAGETILARMIADYLARPTILDIRPDWLLSLPNHLVTAFEAFRTEPEFEVGRKAYALVLGKEIPDLVDAYAGGLHRTLVDYGIARLMSVLSGEPRLRDALKDRFGVQMQAIEIAWQRFVSVAYAKLIVRINAQSHRGNAGIFGATELMTWACAGRVMFTFHGSDGQMTFVADDSDPTGERSGPNSPGAPWQSCVDMINGVTDHWDIDKLQRSDIVGPALSKDP